MTEAKTSLKRTLVGKVVSDKRAKTVTVLVERRVKHELYGKIVTKSSKYHAHDEKGEYHTRRHDRDHRKPADLQDQELGRDPPGREGRGGLIPRADARQPKRPTMWAVFLFQEQHHMIKVGDTLPARHPAGIFRSRGRGLQHRPEPGQGEPRPPRARPSRCSRCPAPSRRPARPSTCPATSQQLRRLQGRRRRRDLVRERQRRLRDGRLGARPEDRRPRCACWPTAAPTSPRPPA